MNRGTMLPEILLEMLPELLPELPIVGSGRVKPRLRALRATKSGRCPAANYADWDRAEILPETLPILLPEFLPLA